MKYLLPLILLITLCTVAEASEFSHYQQWVLVNYDTLVLRINHGKSYEAYIIPESYRSMIIQEHFGYTTYQALVSKWKDKRPPVGIYAFYLENKSKLWNQIDNRIVTVE